MAQLNYVFKRTEKKYLLTRDQYETVTRMIKRFMLADEYGLSTICNLYFDTESFELARRSIDKPQYKEKLRLRSYGVPTENDRVFLEIKKKYNGIVYKRRISMTLAEAENYIDNGVKPTKDGQILKEIEYFMDYYKPSPVVYLAYDRIAYYGKEDKNVRVTFDMNIRYRDTDLSLGAGDYGDRLIDEDMYLMEIKIAGAMPLWLVNVLSELQIYPTSFSKYGSIYKSDLISRGSNEQIEKIVV